MKMGKPRREISLGVNYYHPNTSVEVSLGSIVHSMYPKPTELQISPTISSGQNNTILTICYNLISMPYTLNRCVHGVKNPIYGSHSLSLHSSKVG